MDIQTVSNDTAKERLLVVAEKLFAEKGFDGVSIREITQCADCNLASVNYYFGNKKNLYFDVFRSRLVPQLSQVRCRFEDILAGQEDMNFESVIRAVVTSFMEKHPLNQDNNEAFHGLMHREIHYPTGAVDIIFNEVIEPFFQVLLDLFRSHLTDEEDELEMKLKIFSLIAMTLHFSHARTIIRLITGREYDEHFINRIIDHIVSFTLYGLAGENGSRERHS
ncbi:MAG: CerR family C-terminal domain-containing protein [Desulfobacterales bacterium]